MTASPRRSSTTLVRVGLVALILWEVGSIAKAQVPDPSQSKTARVEMTPKDSAPPRPEIPKKSRPVNSLSIAPNENASVGRKSVVRLFAEANPMLWPLLICSVVSLGFALERLVALRRERVIPRDFVSRFVERLASGKLDRDRAVELCKANESAVARSSPRSSDIGVSPR